MHAFASELLTQGRVGDDTFALAVARFGYQTVVELVGVAGFYSMVALTLNAFAAPPRTRRLHPALRPLSHWMAMTFWLPETGAALAPVEGQRARGA